MIDRTLTTSGQILFKIYNYRDIYDRPNIIRVGLYSSNINIDIVVDSNDVVNCSLDTDSKRIFKYLFDNKIKPSIVLHQNGYIRRFELFPENNIVDNIHVILLYAMEKVINELQTNDNLSIQSDRDGFIDNFIYIMDNIPTIRNSMRNISRYREFERVK